MKMYIGNNIQYYRKKANLTQKELANRLETTDKRIWSWEHNRTEPEAGYVQKMASIFGCTVDELCKQINVNVSFEEFELLERFRAAPITSKKEIKQFMKFATERREVP